MKTKGVAISVQKGFPTDVQVIIDANGCYLMICTKVAVTAIPNLDSPMFSALE